MYDSRTAAEGGTNADDVTDVLRGLPVAIRKENTSAVWHREEQVLLENPDLIVSHLSTDDNQTRDTRTRCRRAGDRPAALTILAAIRE